METLASGIKRWVPLYAVKLIGLPKSDEKWVARLWNVSEERVINTQVNFTTTPFNARSSRFQGVPPRNLRLNKVNGVGWHVSGTLVKSVASNTRSLEFPA